MTNDDLKAVLDRHIAAEQRKLGDLDGWIKEVAELAEEDANSLIGDLYRAAEDACIFHALAAEAPELACQEALDRRLGLMLGIEINSLERAGQYVAMRAIKGAWRTNWAHIPVANIVVESLGDASLDAMFGMEKKRQMVDARRRRADLDRLDVKERREALAKFIDMVRDEGREPTNEECRDQLFEMGYERKCANGERTKLSISTISADRKFIGRRVKGARGRSR